MQELIKHPFVISTVAFFIVFIATIIVLLWTWSEKVTIDTSAWQVIKQTSNNVVDILERSHNAPDEVYDNNN